MLFAFPYAWIAGAVAVAGLVAVYTFRSRHRRRPVSSLMLWRQVARPRQGGARRDTLRVPPLFWLELLALAVLSAAAAAPHAPRAERRTLTVVFDASVSMSARGEDGATAQARAVEAFRDELARHRYARIRLLAAGAAGPETAGVVHPSQAAARAARVRCSSPVDTLDAALARAVEVSDEADDILVLTDRPPPSALQRPGLRWLACGAARPNAAVTYADRSWRPDGTEALLVEVSGFGTGTRIPVRVGLMEGGRDGHPSAREHFVSVPENGAGRLVLELPAGTPAVSVELPEDALAADNRVVLLPETPRPVTAAVRLREDAPHRAAERALAATGRVRMDAERPQLVFTDSVREEAPYWQAVLVAPEAARWVLGPYLADRAHPLLEGVGVEGVAWAVGTNALPGRPLLLAGSEPLLTLEASPRRMPVLRLQADARMAALFQSAAWPSLVWNVVQACAEAQPGPEARNLRAGGPARFAVARGETHAVFETPEGEKTLKARAGRVTWSPGEAGLYRMRLPEGEDAVFTVNLFAAREADLRGCAAGRWDAPPNAERLRRTHRSYAWLAGLAALVLVALHQAALAFQAKRGGFA
jgi:hypothetical protein